MKRITPASAVRMLSVLVLASGTYALAEDRGPEHFSGLINDYTPASVSGGPYEMHGQWSMQLHRERGTADFYADMTMSSWTIPTGDPTQAGFNPHTHHIRLTDVAINTDATDAATCPTYKTPTTVRFQINGPLSLMTGNGNVLKGETDPPTSTLQVCVSGGPLVEYSNITLVFGAPASNHFGQQGVHGDVRKVSHDSDEHR